jgi:transposase
MSGPAVAAALVAFPAGSIFRSRRFGAWLCLVTSPHSSDGKERLWPITEMGERSLRPPLMVGAGSVNKVAGRDPDKAAWPVGMLIAVALTNKMARII